MESLDLVAVGDVISSGVDVASVEIAAVAFILFAIGILIGLVFFHIFSRRWFA